MPRLSRLVALGAAAAAYSLYEPYRFRLESKAIAVARPITALTVLHVSDTHMNAHDTRLIRFLEQLPSRLDGTPDLIVATGDLIEGNDGIDPLVSTLNGLDARLGRFYVL